MNSGVAYLLLFCTVSIVANIGNSDKVPNYRLPETIQPLDYVVELLIAGDIGTEPVFKGRVSMKVQVLNKTSEIVLHVAESVLIHSVDVFDDTSRNDALEIKEKLHDKKTEIYTIKMSKLRKDQKVNIVIEYVGTLHDDMYGFYRSSYREKDKTK